MRTIAIGLAVVVWVEVQASAQTPATAVPIAQCAVRDTAVMADLTSAFESGSAEKFEEAAARILAFVRACTAVEGDDRTLLATIDVRSDYVLLVWPGSDALAERILYSAVVHTGDGPHGRTLPGIGVGSRARLFQVLLAPSALDRLAGVYVSEPERSVLEGQLPLVAAAIANPLLAAIAAQQGTLAARQQALSAAGTPVADVPAWASVAMVRLPFRRASIRVELRASVAPAVASIEHDAGALGNRMAFLEAPHVPCARDLAAQFAAIVTALARTCAERPQACIDSADPQLSSAFDLQQGRCRGETPADTRRNMQALARVDAGFRGYVEELDRTVLAAALQLENVPRTRYHFGLLTGYLAGARETAARARTIDGLITADPLPRQLSMVVVNGAFRPYDSLRPSPAWPERVQWFLGTVIAPDLGAGAGLSLLIVRGLALDAGVAVLAVRTPARGEAIGRAPVDAADPFRISGARGVFAGVSYTFK